MSGDTVNRLLELFDKRLLAQAAQLDKRVDAIESAVAMLTATVEAIGNRVADQSGAIDALEVGAARADTDNRRRWLGVRTRAVEDHREVVELLVALPVRRGLLVAIGTAVLVGLAGWLGI